MENREGPKIQACGRRKHELMGLKLKRDIKGIYVIIKMSGQNLAGQKRVFL